MHEYGYMEFFFFYLLSIFSFWMMTMMMSRGRMREGAVEVWEEEWKPCCTKRKCIYQDRNGKNISLSSLRMAALVFAIEERPSVAIIAKEQKCRFSAGQI